MNTNEKYTLANLVVEHALNKGAEQVSVIISDNRSSDIEIRDQNIDNLKEAIQNRLTISLYVDKKYSEHTTNRMKKDELFRFVDEAIEATRYLAEDQFRSLPDPELYYKGGGEDLMTFDKTFDTIDAKTKIDIANQILNEAYQKDERIISVSSYYSDSISSRVMVKSNGFKGDSSRTNVSLVVTVSVKTDTGRPSGYHYEVATFYNKLKKADIGRKALERTLQKIDSKKIISGKYPVIIENRVVPNILGPMISALQGSSLYDKQSFLIGKQNKPVASPKLTMTDDPFLQSGFGSRLFDNDGLASVKRPIVEEGVLKNYYIDDYYGKKLGMKPTTESSSNIVFSLGTKTMKEMMNSMKKGILITEFNGGNCNGTTGDFSYGIEGYLVEEGKIIHPVNEMNITGNMNDFWFSLTETGNDPNPGDTIMAPSLMFDSVDFSGI